MRFLVEFVRTNDVVFVGLTMAQLISVAMIAIGAVWMLVVLKRYGTLARPESQAFIRAV